MAAVILIGAGAWLVLRGDPGPTATDAVRAYAAAWSRGDDAAAARATDHPRAAVKALRLSRKGLDGATVSARAGAVDEETGRARIAVRWKVPGYGAFAYDTRVKTARHDGRWFLRWQPRVLHPRLRDTTRLGTAVDVPDRAPIEDRTGRGLVTERGVVDVAVQVDRVRDPNATAQQLTSALDAGLDAGKLARSIRAAPRGRFLPVITLRSSEFVPLANTLGDIPGVALNRTTRPLAPSADYGRALLGTVGPPTAEQLEKDPALSPGEPVGQSGLSARFDRRLAGSATRRIVIRDRVGATLQSTLARKPGTRPRPVRTTLDADVQGAAERALTDRKANAALVAVQPSTGDVLAVANRPADSTYDRAMTGNYPPGSTFKIVSTAALLRGGLNPSETVDCPPTLAIEGKSFRNFEGGAAGAVPFAVDFARSCNTAFVTLGDRLKPDTLTAVAKDFGLGRKPRPGVAVADSSVPPAKNTVAQAAMMIGQDRILASPLALAGMAAAVQDGRWRAPRVLQNDRREAGPPIPEAPELQTLMRQVVTEGTGTALAGVAGAPIGKSGTAEYGGGDPPPTHAWFVSARGDLALAVLVEGGAAGSRDAAPLAAAFYAALDR